MKGRVRKEIVHGEATCSYKSDCEHHNHRRNEAEGHNAHGRKGTLNDDVFDLRQVEGCDYDLVAHIRKRCGPCHTRAKLCPSRRNPMHLRGGPDNRQGLDMEGATRRHLWTASESGNAESGVDKWGQTKRT